jgi:hypothetical protein
MEETQRMHSTSSCRAWPWCAFSHEHRHAGGLFKVHHTWHELMTMLGYARYAAHGGDWGSTITEHIARSHAGAVLGIHLTDVPFWHALRPPDDLIPIERQYIDDISTFQEREGAYALIHGTKPQTLTDALNDSPDRPGRVAHREIPALERLRWRQSRTASRRTRC